MTAASLQDRALAKEAAQVLGSLGSRLKAVPQSIQKLLVVEIAELSADQQLEDLLSDMVSANVDTWFSTIRYSIPIDRVEPPTAALEHARQMAQREVPVNALLRAYRLGHQHGLNFIVAELRRAALAPELKLDLYEHITRASFRYIDWMSEQVLKTYQLEREQWDENRGSMRARAVRDILDGRDVDVAEVSSTMEYALDATHLALVVWLGQDDNHDPDQPMVLERFVRQAGAAVAAEQMIYHSIDRLVAYAWMTVPDPSNAVTRLRAFVQAQPDSPKITVGQPLSGLHGFRRTYWQAEQAHAVVTTANDTSRRFVAAQDPGLPIASILVANIASMKDWIHDVLGPLAQCTASDRRLRDTLRVFLRRGSSFKAAAEELQIHANIVKYRVNRAVERRGRPIAGDRPDLEMALLMCDWFGDGVLT